MSVVKIANHILFHYLFSVTAVPPLGFVVVVRGRLSELLLISVIEPLVGSKALIVVALAVVAEALIVVTRVVVVVEALVVVATVHHAYNKCCKLLIC